MNARPAYVTETRRNRARTYRARVRIAVAISILLHLLVFLAVSPDPGSIPLVRHIGYRGALRILPEISVLKEPGEIESDPETAHGRGSESFFDIVGNEVVDWTLPSGTPPEDVTEDALGKTGEELHSRLETSLPQPTSDDLVIVRLVKPVYPASSIEAGVEGVVVLRAHVTRTGDVARAWLLESEVDDACEIEAHRAVLQWKFMPFVVNGEALDILVDQRIRFRLHDVTFTPRSERRNP
jgi:TonB family protein